MIAPKKTDFKRNLASPTQSFFLREKPLPGIIRPFFAKENLYGSVA